MRKRMWQSIVCAKVVNQASVLRWSGKTVQAATIFKMAERVRSGDPDNVEATAAQRYFPALFGEAFVRRNEDGRNAALNYGYAILRGAVARTLAVYGFLPAFGIHHRSALNAFNLADDLMEPFRPLVDMIVSVNVDAEDVLTRETKRQLFNCLNLDVISGGAHHSTAYAIERLVQSLGRSLTGKTTVLLLPEIRELKQHRYE